MSVADLVVDVPPHLEDIKPGWVAVVVILLLIVVTTLLWLNMRKHLGRISFEEKETPKRRSRKPPAA
jgi:hypothetical protein